MKSFLKCILDYLVGLLVCAADAGPQQSVAFQAAADLSSKRYHIMRLSAANNVNQASLGTDTALIGVLQNKPKSGEAATISYLGKSKVTAAASCAANQLFTTNGSGRATIIISGSMVVGRYLESPTADGDVVNALLMIPVTWGNAA